MARAHDTAHPAAPAALPRRHGGASPLAQPFLKWAGGKRQLLPELRRFYPHAFGAYHEPFIGSGAVFFDLLALGALEGHPVHLADTSPDVVGCYRAIRDDLPRVLRALQQLARGHAAHGATHYYDVRDTRFNPARRRLIARGDAGAGAAYPPTLAAMLLYLNRTGFNGLFRLNARGEFNVPAGRYDNPRVCDRANLRAVSRGLAKPGLELAVDSFESVLGRARPGDFLYFDPPYAPVSETARFTAYTAGGFGQADQVRLQRVVVALAARGCQVLLSNSSAPLVGDLYARDASARDVGLRIWRVAARRAINSRATGRGTVTEYLITNVRPRRDELAAAG